MPQIDIALRQALDEGDLERAAGVARSLSADDLQRADIELLCGRLAWAQGDEAAAALHFDAVLKRTPPSADAHFWRAVLYMHQGHEDLALEHALAAERLQAGNAELQALMGVVQYHRGDKLAACASFVSVLDVDAANVHALRGLAAIHFENQDWAKAECRLRSLLALMPDDAELWSNHASSLVALGREDEAWPEFQRALDLARNAARVREDYAIALFNAGCLAEAGVQFDEALACDPARPILHVARANCSLIRDGNSAAAWTDYEWRRQVYATHFAVHTRSWDGRPGTAQRLLLYAEQGIGDVILFARHVAALRGVVGSIVLQVPPSLSRLMQQSALRFDWPVTGWVESQGRLAQDAVQYDSEAPLLSLMHLCGFEVTPATRPYMDVDASLVRDWACRLGPRRNGRLRVGLVWAGNPVRVEDSLRSILPEQLAPLKTVDNVDFISLQMEAKAQYRASALPFTVIDPTAEIRDFADTAAIMRNLDLVLSIDTAAAHLAGALGVPCWVLLSKIPDWRWEMGSVDQPWYGSHRTFRVPRQRDWLPLMRLVAAQLNVLSRQASSDHTHS